MVARSLLNKKAVFALFGIGIGPFENDVVDEFDGVGLVIERNQRCP